MEPTNPLPQTALWQTKYAAAYMEDDRMVIRYQFPYTKDREANLLGAYAILPKERMSYYQTLIAMCERNIAISNYFKSENVPSILTFEHTCQRQEENGVICIDCYPDTPVTPITQSYLSGNFTVLTALDIFLRLAHILRDISKTPMSPVLRYLDMDDVYLTQDNKILLGGFYYAAAEGLPAPPPYLKDAAPVVDRPPELQIEDAGTDMRILAKIAWNIFSGLPWDTAHTNESLRIPPRYAPIPLLKALNIGLEGYASDCNSFRKRLMAYRKELAKTDYANQIIPGCYPHKKTYAFNTKTPPTPSSKKAESL